MTDKSELKKLRFYLQMAVGFVILAISFEVVSTTLFYVWRKDMQARITRLEKLHGSSQDSGDPGNGA